MTPDVLRIDEDKTILILKRALLHSVLDVRQTQALPFLLLEALRARSLVESSQGSTFSGPYDFRDLTIMMAFRTVSETC